MINIGLILNSVMLGIGLAMDAFSVSLANGLNEPNMSKARVLLIASTFAGFQFVMPIIGWFCVHNLAEMFQTFQIFIPYIALILLLYIGGKMLIEGIRESKLVKGGESDAGVLAGAETVTASHMKLMLAVLAMQGIATSIDALSVGFTISNYDTVSALLSSIIIGIVTLVICLAGLAAGKKFGVKLVGKTSILGGLILIFIGIKVCFFT